LKPKEIIVSKQKSVVERYIEGFRRSDHAQILSCLADDIVWDLYGYKTIKGKAAFDAEIENEDFEGRPSLTINRLIEEGNTVVAIGSGSVSKRDGNLMKFVFSEVFTFAGDLVSHLETYHIWLN
jgi:ketosteroid isomerase-like protein